ncbi:hypothetical protein SAMN04488109_0109 [Chryseolinea serpens]|uniref:Uncharacterized protein n=1 Tax=Chryseolinea serpens TaxID=947013 RepID=A0A1M5JJY3_9BACT|nr:hypothetical protein SAMN04488109_0109 [Chryseolinea serpens]
MLLNTYCEAQTLSKITSDHIRIDQAGPRDAMMAPIIITTEKVQVVAPESFVQVDKRLFESLSEYIKSSEDLLREGGLDEFGVFKVTSFIDGKAETYFTGTRQKSAHFFKEFRTLLKDLGSPEELIQRVDKTLARIDY